MKKGGGCSGSTQGGRSNSGLIQGHVCQWGRPTVNEPCRDSSADSPIANSQDNKEALWTHQDNASAPNATARFSTRGVNVQFNVQGR